MSASPFLVLRTREGGALLLGCSGVRLKPLTEAQPKAKAQGVPAGNPRYAGMGAIDEEEQEFKPLGHIEMDHRTDFR